LSRGALQQFDHRVCIRKKPVSPDHALGDLFVVLGEKPVSVEVRILKDGNGGLVAEQVEDCYSSFQRTKILAAGPLRSGFLNPSMSEPFMKR